MFLAMRVRFWTAAFAACLFSLVSVARADDPFRERIVPFIQEYCSQCHNADLAEAELNLAKYQSAEMAAEDFRQWEHVITFLKREEMPPQTSKRQPTAELRADILKTLQTVLHSEARKVAGDPGAVLPRRLSNAEYDHTIRDLTGVDIRPTRAFPVDPAAGEGFDNTGEALTMSPALFQKLYGAAQHVADHAVLTTTGLEFAPYPVVTLADKTTFYEQAILQFYEQHQINREKYLTACWEYRHRPPARTAVTIEEWARERRLSSRYLSSLNEVLNGDPAADLYYVGWLRRRWQAIPAPTDRASPTLAPEAEESIHRLSREIRALSTQICPKETEAIVSHAGNAPIEHLERRAKTAAERDTFDPQSIRPNRRLNQEFKNLDRRERVRVVISAMQFGPDRQPGQDFVNLKSMNFSMAPVDNYQANDEKRNFPLRKLLTDHAPDQLDRLKFGVHPNGAKIDAEMCVISAPGSVEFEVPVKAFGGAKEIRFFLDAELDRQHTKSNLLTVSLTERSPAEGKNSSDTKPQDAPSNELLTLLIDPDQPSAGDIAQSGKSFCRLFPNRFYYVDETRGLSAGFHLIEGFFRDDQPLCKLVLNDEENRELSRLWTELEFVTEITEKMLRGFVFFERSERNFIKHEDFDPFKEDDPKLIEPETLGRFERIYLNHANLKAPLDELRTHPIHLFFERIRDGLKLRQEQLRQAKSAYLKDIEDLAKAAYRRPLTAKELDDLRDFFSETVDQQDHNVEHALRASLVRILVSPYFGCRIDPSPDGNTVQPLNDLALATRLSYFLWSSMPDVELRGLAEAGKLHNEDVLLAQTRRMLKDDKVTDFAREFYGQWLGYRDFPQQEAVDRNLFKDFDDSLKEAMFEEPTRLAAHLIRHDLPVTQLLDSDITFVNERLARHYGLPYVANAASVGVGVGADVGSIRHGGPDWALVEGLRNQGRGGILGMAVFLTKNSQPQRTSPVKRGFWVVHKVLGEHIPAPPADVVALPAKETDTNGKTVRELLALHVESAKCARCHIRFDAVGLAMEGFDPIGRQRTKDLAGRLVDNVVKLPDGGEAHGIPEFARHLLKDRRQDYVNTLCRKLLGYALGRSLQLSDDVLLEDMQLALDKNGDRFVPLFETIVRSPQFRNQRCRDFSTASFRIKNEDQSRKFE